MGSGRFQAPGASFPFATWQAGSRMGGWGGGQSGPAQEVPGDTPSGFARGQCREKPKETAALSHERERAGEKPPPAPHGLLRTSGLLLSTDVSSQSHVVCSCGDCTLERTPDAS